VVYNRHLIDIDMFTGVFCGHNNLPKLQINSAIIGDQGVFRSLLAFRLNSRDEILHEH